MGIVSLLILSLPAAAPGGAGVQERLAFDPVASYLKGRMGFGDRDLRDIHAGRAVARTIESPSGDDVGILGAVRIAAPMPALVARLRRVAIFEPGVGVLDLGVIGAEPRLEDFARLTLDRGDLEAMPACRPGSCDVQLPAARMAEFRTAVAWKAPDAAEQANRMMRRMLLDLVAAYRANGLGALGRYDDHQPPSVIADEMRRHAAARDLPVPIPHVLRGVTAYPADRPDGVEDFFYWSKVDFGRRPTIRLNHLALVPLADAPQGVRWVAATTQLYATHYFSSTLELRFLAEDAVRPGGFYLLYVTRSRIPGLGGFVGALVRPFARNRARDSLARHLDYARQVVEADAGRAADNRLGR